MRSATRSCTPSARPSNHSTWPSGQASASAQTKWALRLASGLEAPGLGAEVAGAWGAATGIKCAEAIEAWLSGDAAARMEGCEDLARQLFTQKGELRSLKSLEKDRDSRSRLRFWRRDVAGDVDDEIRALFSAVRG